MEEENSDIYATARSRASRVMYNIMQLGLLVIIPMIIEDENLVKLKNERHFVTAILTFRI